MNISQSIYINGRFLCAAPTGVQRTAAELVASLDRLLGKLCPVETTVELLHPQSASPPAGLTHIQTRAVGRLTGLAWEQFELPVFARRGLLLNLCNVGPLLKRNSVTMIHDMQTRTQPASYSLAFRTWYAFAQPIIGVMHRRILTVSSYSKQEIAAHGIARADRITCVPNGCDHLLEPSGAADVNAFELEREGYVLSLASTQAHKNLRVLLSAFADPRLKGLKLALFGSASRSDCAQAGMAVPDNVVFLGRVDDNSLASLMSNALCLASPSLTEGFGLTPLEAMRMGCPTIIAPCGALPETCGDASLYADPHDHNAWIEAVLSLGANRQLASELRRMGVDRAELYSWDNAARRLLDVVMTPTTMSLQKRTVDEQKTIVV